MALACDWKSSPFPGDEAAFQMINRLLRGHLCAKPLAGRLPTPAHAAHDDEFAARMFGERGAAKPAKRYERGPLDMLGVVLRWLAHIHNHGLIGLLPFSQRCGINVFNRHG